jgi:ATP-dependent DNA ligase
VAEAEVRLGAGVRHWRLHGAGREPDRLRRPARRYYDGRRLRYAGKVGTGYTAATLRSLGARLRELETPESPFVDARPVPRGVHWTRPALVAQIGFAEWTREGRLRQPRFLGLRDDKRPNEVVRELPA